MDPLSHAFQFVRDVHVKITNQSGGTAKVRPIYYIKEKNAHNKYLFRRSKKGFAYKMQIKLIPTKKNLTPTY